MYQTVWCVIIDKSLANAAKLRIFDYFGIHSLFDPVAKLILSL